MPREEGEPIVCGSDKEKELAVRLMDFLSLMHGLKDWQYWHSHTNCAFALLHHGLSFACSVIFSSP